MRLHFVAASFLLFAVGRVESFTNPVSAKIRKSFQNYDSPSDFKMSMFDDVQNFFSNFGGDDDKKSSSSKAEHPDNRIVSIPVRSMKPGGLRLFLMFYLMGMQNTPDANAWKADQPTREEYVIDFYFHDRTAMLTVVLSDDKITIDRIGTSPSNAYVMQETVIVQGILDELHQCAFDDTIEEENRLLQLVEPKDAIDQARAALSFG